MNLSITPDSEPSDFGKSPLAKSPGFRRRILRWVFIGFPVVVLATVGWLWNSTARELQSRLNDLKAKGLPTSASEVNDFYKIPKGVNDRTQEWATAIRAVEAANLRTLGKDLPLVGDGSCEVPPPGQPWPDFEASRSLIRHLDTELQMIRLAASVPGQVRFPYDFSDGINTLLPGTQNARQITRLLELDAYVSAHEGKFARTKQDVEDIFALSNALSGEPCVTSQLVRLAIFSVATSALEQHSPYCGWTDSELSALQEIIRSASFEVEMQRAMASETAIMLSEIDKLPIGPFRPSNKLELMILMNEASEALTQPWPKPLTLHAESVARLKSIESKSSLYRIKHMGLNLYAPTIELMGQATCRAVARQRYVDLGISAYRCQLKTGRLPDSLNDLDLSLISGTTPAGEYTTDPFDGKPLRFRKEATGRLIYSVSENLIDNGGDVTTSDKNGRVGDAGFRVILLPENVTPPTD